MILGAHLKDSVARRWIQRWRSRFRGRYGCLKPQEHIEPSDLLSKVRLSCVWRAGLRAYCVALALSPLQCFGLVRGICLLRSQLNDLNVICDRFVGRALRSGSEQHVRFFTFGVCFQVVVLMTRFGINNVTSRILQTGNVLWSA